MTEETIDCRVSLVPDGATSWLADIEIPEWGLTVVMYAFTAEGENEAMFAMHRFVKQNLEKLRGLGPGRLSLIAPWKPTFESAVRP